MAGGLVDEAEVMLREWLRQFTPPADGRLPSERALTLELKLQHYAVNRAMARLVTEGLVQRDGYKLFYRPQAPQKAAVPREEVCELVVAQRSVYMTSYRKAAREVGIELNVHPWQSAEEMVAILQALNAKKIQCVVIDPPFGHPSAIWHPAVLRLMKQGVPVVSIAQQAPGVPCVMPDGGRAVGLLLNHLVDLGHREMVFLTVPPWNSSTDEMLDQWKSVCRKLGLKKSAERVWLYNDTRLMSEDIRTVARRFHADWSDVTALVTYTENEGPAQRMLDDLAAENVRVPDRISLAFVGDSKTLKFSVPPITATAVDVQFLQETAFQLALRCLRISREKGVVSENTCVRVQEALVARQSTVPGPFYKAAVVTQRENVEVIPQPVPLVEPEAALDLDVEWRRPYDLTSKAPEDRFASIDLGPFVNRPINFRRGWLGDLPLRRLSLGRQVVHGVPFEILGGNKRSDCGAIVFRSLLNTTGSEKKLPCSVEIPVERKATALYVLHGCGYARFLHQFATYTFFSGKKELGKVPIVCLGRPMPSASPVAVAEAVEQSNIQDWWPDFPHYNFAHARMAPLLENEMPDTAHRHVYLYTLEWVNPYPKSMVTHMRMEANAEQSTTLGVLAVSALTAS